MADMVWLIASNEVMPAHQKRQAAKHADTQVSRHDVPGHHVRARHDLFRAVR